MSPTAARNVAATITLTPGTVISRLTCGEPSASRAICLLDLGDLLVEELDLAQTAVDRFALLDRQLDLAQPFAAGEAEQVADRRFLDQPPHQHGVALVLRARARPDQLAAPSQPPPQRPRPLVGHPQPVQRARRRAASPAPGRRAGRSSRAPAGSPCRPDARPAPRRRAARGSARSPTRCRSPRAPPDRSRRGSARTAPASPVSSRSAPPNGPRLPRRSRPRRSRGEHPTQCSSPALPSSPSIRREPVGKRHRRIRAHSTPGPVAGAATEKSGSKPIAQETACPACVPQRAPVPVSRTYGQQPGQQPSDRSFMPRKATLCDRRAMVPTCDLAQNRRQRERKRQ